MECVAISGGMNRVYERERLEWEKFDDVTHYALLCALCIAL